MQSKFYAKIHVIKRDMDPNSYLVSIHKQKNSSSVLPDCIAGLGMLRTINTKLNGAAQTSDITDLQVCGFEYFSKAQLIHTIRKR